MSACKRNLLLILMGIFCMLFAYVSNTRTMRIRRSISEINVGEIASSSSSSSSSLVDGSSCSKINESFCDEDEDGCLPPAVTKNWQLMVHAKRYRLSHCVILKDLSTIMMAIFCYLNDPETFSTKNRTITTEYWKIRACKGMNEWTAIQPSLLGNQTWKHLAVIREPIERFLSGWVDKCYNNHARMGKYQGYCYNCGKNLTCFVDRFYAKMKIYNTTLISRDFIMENHFWPQSWYCNFTHHLKNYTILKYNANSKGEFYANLAEIFKGRRVPQAQIEEILHQGLANFTSHTVSGKSILQRFRNELHSNQRLMKLLVRIFYKDYMLFNYPLPCI